MAKVITPYAKILVPTSDDPRLITADLLTSFSKVDSTLAQQGGESAAALTTSEAAQTTATQALARALAIEEPVHVGPNPPTDGETLWVDTDEEPEPTPVVVDWETVTDKPGSFPSTIPDVAGLEDALAAAGGEAWMRPIATMTDANTVVTEGIHPIIPQNVLNVANRPSDARYAVSAVTVTPLSDGVVHQLWAQYEPGAWRRWERARVGGTWRAWVELAGALTPPTPAPPQGTQTRSSSFKVSCIGDSLTRGYSSGAQWADADSYPALLGAWLGPEYTVTNLGSSGATTDQMNETVGALSLLMRVPSGTIPASGTVALESDTAIGQWGGPYPFTTYGYLDDLWGVLAYTPAGGYVFTRAAAGAAITTTRARWRGRYRRENGDQTAIYFAGRNDITMGQTGMEATVADHVIRGTRDFIEEWPTVDIPQIALCGTITRTDETPGSSGFEAVQEISTRLRLLYPANFLDVQGYLTGAAVWTDTGITPTQADLDAQALGKTPPSLFDDVTHYSRATARAIAEHLIGPFLKQKGWI